MLMSKCSIQDDVPPSSSDSFFSAFRYAKCRLLLSLQRLRCRPLHLTIVAIAKTEAIWALIHENAVTAYVQVMYS